MVSMGKLTVRVFIALSALLPLELDAYSQCPVMTNAEAKAAGETVLLGRVIAKSSEMSPEGSRNVLTIDVERLW